MSSVDRSARRLAPTAVAAALGAGLLAAPAVPAQAAEAPPPTVHYTFDQDDLSSGKIIDSSGNGRTASLVNSSTAESVEGTDGGKALALPGGSSASDGAYVRLPREVLADATDLTVSTRVKWSGSTSPWQRLFDLGTDTSAYLNTTPYSGDGTLRTSMTTGEGGAETQVNGYTTLPANEWRTVTVTLDTSADRLTTYLDGVAISSAKTSMNAKDLLGSSATAAGYIGKSFWPDQLFKGAIDDFTVWHSALSPDQVAGMFENIPAFQQLSRTSFEVRTTTGTAPSLPAAVRSSFSDGFDRDMPITWEAVPAEKYAQPGTFTVAGTAAGRAVQDVADAHRIAVGVVVLPDVEQVLGRPPQVGDLAPVVLVAGGGVEAVGVDAVDDRPPRGTQGVAHDGEPCDLLAEGAAAGAPVVLEVVHAP